MHNIPKTPENIVEEQDNVEANRRRINNGWKSQRSVEDIQELEHQEERNRR